MILVTLLFSLHGVSLTAFEIRAIAEISHLYLFNQTPIEIVSLAFLLVVTYAASGSRMAMFRLQALFIPIVITIAFFVIILSLGSAELKNSQPYFQTNLDGYMISSFRSMISISSLGVIGYFLFYISLIKEPKHTTKNAILGLTWIYFIHIALFLACILVFGKSVTSNLMFPVIELARTVEIPGEFFTRFESLFFVIWIMTVFNTSIFTFDIAVLGIQSLFKKINKINIVLFLAPLIYLLGGIPKNSPEVGAFGSMIGYFGFFLTIIVTVTLLLMLKIKGVKKVE